MTLNDVVKEYIEVKAIIDNISEAIEQSENIVSTYSRGLKVLLLLILMVQ